MTHRWIAEFTSCRRMALALVASGVLTVASPVVSSSSASNGGGADRSVSAQHGDCKHHNSGVHNGYDCPDGSGGGTTTLLGGGVLAIGGGSTAMAL